MRNQFLTALVLGGAALICSPGQASAQLLPPAASAFAQAPAGQAPAPAPAAAQNAQDAPLPPGPLTKTPCGNQLSAPEHIRATPPAGTTFIWMWDFCFPTQEGPNVEPETYQYYVKFPGLVSRPAEGVWSPWNEAAENVARNDFLILMRDTTFLDDLRIERAEFTFPNGAVGIIVSYIMEERQRVKIVDYRNGKGE